MVGKEEHAGYLAFEPFSGKRVLNTLPHSSDFNDPEKEAF